MRQLVLRSFLLIAAMLLAACGTVTTSSVPVDGDADNDNDSTETDCIFGTFVCQGDEVHQCSDRGAWTFVMDCRLQGSFICREGQCVKTDATDGDTTDGDATDGDTTDTDATDGDTTDGDTTDGDTTDTDATDGDTTDGDATDGDATDGDAIDGDTTDGDTDADTTDGDTTDGDVDADTTDADTTDADIDVDIDLDLDVDIDSDLDLTDGDIDVDADSELSEWECSGTCDPSTESMVCMGDLAVCVCDGATNNWRLDDCGDVCADLGFTEVETCGYHEQTGRDICFCFEQECQSDQECINAAKGDYCIALGLNTFCAERCSISKCDSGTACVDIGVGDGCGACIDRQNDPSCETVGQQCGTDKVCHDLCGLWDATCSSTCEAIPSTCPNSGELCWPVEATGIGVIDGICVNFGADCPYCDNADGDVDEDDDSSACANPCQDSYDCSVDQICDAEGCCIPSCNTAGAACQEGASCNPNTGICEWCSPTCAQNQCCNYSETFWYCGSCCNPPCGDGQACQSGSCVDLACPDCDPDEICNADTGYICVKYDDPIDGDVNRTPDGRECLPPNVECIDGVDTCCSGTCLMGTCL